jgi:hypothetical protein
MLAIFRHKGLIPFSFFCPIESALNLIVYYNGVVGDWNPFCYHSAPFQFAGQQG